MFLYIVRRLLLMIPTLLGVTIVSFLVMQLAPGDPLLSGDDSQTENREGSREVYLTQKRAMGLDKPAFINLSPFRDYRDRMRAAAYFLGRDPARLAEHLSSLTAASGSAESAKRLEFLRTLQIPDLEQRLGDPADRAHLAQTIVDFVQIWCEDTGASAVPSAIAILEDHDSSTALRRGAVRGLNHMVSDPFVYHYSRKASKRETPLVENSWRLWWEPNRKSFARHFGELTPERRKHLRTSFEALVASKSRNELMERLQRYHKSDVPFFVERLLGDTSLAEKDVAAQMLQLYIGKPLPADVPVDAGHDEVAMVAQNWLSHYRAEHHQQRASLSEKLWTVVADTQYSHMLVRLATFRFGYSATKMREPVAPRIWRAFLVSAPLMLASEVLIYLVAVPLGIVCAVHRNRWLDRVISSVLFVLYSVPTFVAAMIMLLLFCYGIYWKWFPMSGLHSELADEMAWGAWLVDYAWHTVLPVVCLSIFSLAGMAMYARSSMLGVLQEDYIRTARAKGVSEKRVVWVHALRNALIPLITLFADFLPAMLGGSVLVEVLFSIPGMGRLSWAAIEQKDYPTLMALVYIDAIVVLFSILLSDLLYYVVDPRISLDAAAEVA